MQRILLIHTGGTIGMEGSDHLEPGHYATALVEQLDGTITLELAHGTRYRIIFRVNPRSRTSLFKRYVKGVILYLKTLHFIFFMISDEGYSDFPYIRKIYFSIYPAIHLQYLHPESSSCI